MADVAQSKTIARRLEPLDQLLDALVGHPSPLASPPDHSVLVLHPLPRPSWALDYRSVDYFLEWPMINSDFLAVPSCLLRYRSSSVFFLPALTLSLYFYRSPLARIHHLYTPRSPLYHVIYQSWPLHPRSPLEPFASILLLLFLVTSFQLSSPSLGLLIEYSLWLRGQY